MKNIPLSELAAQYGALADPVRLRLLSLLLSAGESFVGELAQALELPQSTTSRQLGKLRAIGLVQDRRAGTSAWYSVRRPRAAELSALLTGLAAAAGSCAELRTDAERLRKLRRRPGS